GNGERAFGELQVAAAEDVIGGDAHDEERALDERAEDDVDEAVHAGGVEDHGPEVGDDSPAALDLEPRRGVHPGVGDDNPDGGEDAAQRHPDGSKEVPLVADAVPAEDQYGQETG